MIRVVLEFDSLPDGAASVRVETEEFIPGNQNDFAGTLWAGTCLAINRYMHSRGLVDFDCLRRGAGTRTKGH